MIGPRIEGFRTGQRVTITGGTNLFTGTSGYITKIEQTEGVYLFTVEIQWRRNAQRVLCRSSELRPAD